MGTNLLPYSSFETGATLPSSSDVSLCTVAFDTAHAYAGSGTVALKAITTATSGSYVSPDNAAAYQAGVASNTAYVASVWVYTTAASVTADIYVDQFDSGHTYVTGGAASEISLTANAWTQVVTTFTTGSTSSYVGTTFEFVTPVASTPLWFDAGKIELGSTPSAWTPGPNDPISGLPAPLNLHTTAISSTTVALAWSAVTGATGYELTITAVTAPTTAPTLSGTAGNTQNTLNWTVVSTATSYNLKRGSTTVYSGTNLSFIDTGLTNNTAYSYTVNAANATGQGPYSSALPLTPVASGSTGAWYSGAQGEGVNDQASGTPIGGYADWRGRVVDSETMNNDNIGSEGGYLSSGDMRNYGGVGSVLIGWGTGSGSGSWADAAGGAYDSQWTTIINSFKDAWTAVTRGRLYFQLAHEMNGDWYGWSVRDSTDAANFITAWRRFTNLQRQLFPAAGMAFVLNWNTTTGQDWRTWWPGDSYVDVLGTDYYNFPGNGSGSGIQSSADATASLDATGPNGSPQGLNNLLAWAGQHGVPISIPEWGNPSTQVPDGTAYFDCIFNFATTNGSRAGTPGTLLYETYFNSPGTGFQIYPNGGANPNGAARYAQLW